jgi:hypothetical protein
MAVGLGSMDMPIPSVEKWEWLNWKFPRPVHAGDTIYARWTLTQKRPPVGSVTTAIVVWRVDVHTADGALCAEGEVGASVMRKAVSTAARTVSEPATPATSTSRRRRRRRSTTAGAATKSGADGAVPVAEPIPVAAAATAERSSTSARRRRRRRPAGSSAARNGDAPALVAPTEAAAPPALTPSTATADASSPLRRVIRRLRRP